MRGNLADMLAVVATVDPGNLSAGSHSTDAVDMSKFEEVMFIVAVGTLGTSGTVDFKVQESDQAAGTYSDISGKSITQLTDAGNDDNKQAVVVVKASELTPGKRYVKGVLTVGTAASDACVVAIAGKPRYAPASAFDLSSVDEIVE